LLPFSISSAQTQRLAFPRRVMPALKGAERVYIVRRLAEYHGGTPTAADRTHATGALFEVRRHVKS
jgi:hypothetical protein